RSRVMRILLYGHEVDLPALRPGADLVLRIGQADAYRAPVGTLAQDYLDRDARLRIDAAARAVLPTVVSALSETLDLEDVALARAWEVELLTQIVIPALCESESLGRALEENGTRRVVLAAPPGANGDALAEEVCATLGIT